MIKDKNGKLITKGDTVKVKVLVDSEYTHKGMVTYDEVGDGPDGLYVKGWCSVLGWDEMEVEVISNNPNMHIGGVNQCKKCGDTIGIKSNGYMSMLDTWIDTDNYCSTCLTDLFGCVDELICNWSNDEK